MQVLALVVQAARVLVARIALVVQAARARVLLKGATPLAQNVQSLWALSCRLRA